MKFLLLEGLLEYLGILKFRTMASRVLDNKPLGNFMPKVRLRSTKENGSRRYVSGM